MWTNLDELSAIIDDTRSPSNLYGLVEVHSFTAVSLQILWSENSFRFNDIAQQGRQDGDRWFVENNRLSRLDQIIQNGLYL
jgi:hypothetical protein